METGGDRLGRYRTRLDAALPSMAVFLTLLLLVGLAKVALGGWSISTLATASLMAAAGLAVLFTLVSLIFTVDLYPWGLRGHDGSGRPVRIRWEDVDVVYRMTPFAGLTYLVLRSDSRALWLPLFLRDMDELERRVVDLTASGSALNTYFSKYAPLFVEEPATE